MSDTGCLYAAADVGAGAGAAVGLFDSGGRLLSETLVPLSRYGGSAGGLAEALGEATSGLLDERVAGGGSLCAMGIACPGLFRSDGSALAVANLPFLKDVNLPELVGARLGVPAAIVNDADAGALAEWSLARAELLYWVFGGGWGGAWVSADGRILHPSVDWDGEDASLHYTNEPGYSVPIEKSLLGELFAAGTSGSAQAALTGAAGTSGSAQAALTGAAEGASFERFEALCLDELKKELESEGGELTGPSGRTDCVRAELVPRARASRVVPRGHETARKGVLRLEIVVDSGNLHPARARELAHRHASGPVGRHEPEGHVQDVFSLVRSGIGGCHRYPDR